MGISQIFGVNCSEISGRQLNPRETLIDLLRVGVLFSHYRPRDIPLRIFFYPHKGRTI